MKILLKKVVTLNFISNNNRPPWGRTNREYYNIISYNKLQVMKRSLEEGSLRSPHWWSARQVPHLAGRLLFFFKVLQEAPARSASQSAGFGRGSASYMEASSPSPFGSLGEETMRRANPDSTFVASLWGRPDSRSSSSWETGLGRLGRVPYSSTSMAWAWSLAGGGSEAGVAGVMALSEGASSAAGARAALASTLGWIWPLSLGALPYNSSCPSWPS